MLLWGEKAYVLFSEEYPHIHHKPRGYLSTRRVCPLCLLAHVLKDRIDREEQASTETGSKRISLRHVRTSQVAWWDLTKEIWRTDLVSEVEIDPEARSVSFCTLNLTRFTLVQPRTLDFPYRSVLTSPELLRLCRLAGNSEGSRGVRAHVFFQTQCRPYQAVRSEETPALSAVSSLVARGTSRGATGHLTCSQDVPEHE